MYEKIKQLFKFVQTRVINNAEWEPVFADSRLFPNSRRVPFAKWNGIPIILSPCDFQTFLGIFLR